LLPINAMINTVVISDLSPEDFHDAGEGLGIMAQLPLDPAKSDALEVLSRIRRLSPPDFSQSSK